MRNLINIKIHNRRGIKGADILIEILLIIVIILLIINIFICTRPKDINLVKFREDIETKFESMEKSFRQEFYANQDEMNKKIDKK